MDGREAELDAAERQLGYRQQEIDTALERYERLGVTEERMQQLQEEARKFAARRRYLDEAEAQLTQEKSELADQIRELANQRRQWEEQTCASGGRSPRSSSLRKPSSSIAQQQLDQREAELDARENALAQLQAELRATQREVLEMRLATEETWAQLSGALAPASLTRSISQVRAKLADHYRATLDEMAQRSEQLEAVRRDLAQQLDALEVAAAGAGGWAERRHADIEQQAARLVAREQELDRQQQHYEQMESQWRIERTDYQARDPPAAGDDSRSGDRGNAGGVSELNERHRLASADPVIISTGDLGGSQQSLIGRRLDRVGVGRAACFARCFGCFFARALLFRAGTASAFTSPSRAASFA